MSDERTTGQGAVDNDGRSPEYGDDMTQQQRAQAGNLGASAGMGGSNMSNTGMGSNELGNSTSGAGLGGSSTGSATLGSGATGVSGGGYSANPIGDNIDGAGRDRTDAVSSDETGTLISADKVQGTAVYDAGGERLGTIDSLMLNKRSGKVAYAVMSFGGFLGIGERYHPLPWDVLTYDTDKGGYNIGQTTDQIRGAPNYTRNEIDEGDFSSRGREVDDYYGRASTGAATGII